jgi:MFS family permease
MAFGLLSIFLPLYIIRIGGSLIDIGVMTSTALFLSIPASFFWGYICDKTGHYKRYILVSFLASSTILFLLTFSTDIGLLIILYVVMAIFHVAHESPKNVLIAELYSRDEWEKSFALYEGLTELGWLIGLMVGTFISLASFDAKTTLLMCCGLNFLAFILSAFLMEDPLLVFERGLVSIEKSVDFTYRGITLASKILEGGCINGSLKTENLYVFCCGLSLFSLATSILFTPLPVFFSQNLHLPTSVVYSAFILNSSACAVGYFLASGKLNQQEEKICLQRTVLFRSLLVFMLALSTFVSIHTALFATLVLTLMGFAYALYHVYALSLSMELIPAKKAGLFDVLISLGSAGGAYLGPFIAQTYGFVYVFLLSAVLFLLAYVSFRIFS